MEEADILANLELSVQNLKKNEDKINAIVEAIYLIIKNHAWKLLEIFAAQLQTLAKGHTKDTFELHYFLKSIIKINYQRIQHELEFKFNELKNIILEKQKDSLSFLKLYADIESTRFEKLRLDLKNDIHQRYNEMIERTQEILSKNISECLTQTHPEDINDFYFSGYLSDTECMHREKNKCHRRFYTKQKPTSLQTASKEPTNGTIRRIHSLTEDIKVSPIFLNTSSDETDNEETIHTEESYGNNSSSQSYEDNDDFYASKFNAASPHSLHSASEGEEHAPTHDYEAAKWSYTNERKRIRLGMKVFALKDASHNIWKMAKITRICETLNNSYKYCVKFQSELDFEQLEFMQSDDTATHNDDEDDEIIECDASYIAFSEPPDSSTTLRVNSRVVTLYTNENDERAPYFSSGTICEAPSARNHNRYLVFFDDGFAQYIQKHEAYAIFDALTRPVENLSSDHLKFLEYYFKHYPEKAMVKLEANHVLSACFANRWRVCRVLELDCSLVRLHFTELNHFEWIYRGSFRLLPIYESLRKSSEIDATPISANSRASVARQHLSNRSFNTSTFNVITEGPSDRILMGPESRQRHQYLSHHASTIFPTIRQQTARKSCSAPIKPVQASNAHLQNVTKLSQGTTKILDLEYIIRDQVVTFTPHPCTSACVAKWEETYVIERRYMNPLMMPLLFGWQRYFNTQSVECNRTNRKVVTYMAPCGRVLRNVSEIEKYLFQTNSKMTIDMFAIDSDVRVDREFEPNPANFVNIDDITDGKETVPISCVNCVDDKKPDDLNYSKDRVPLDGVPLDTDPSRLVGCDCTDGCRDKMKCACWLKTLEATTLIGKGEINSSAGYKGRRLHEMVSTGIFECNKNCRCDHRCANRVVQNGVSVRLQLFKTQQKGWGLRCLDDVEKGTFICIYTGHLMTEEQSDIRGRELGDEYFAELDFIECLKKLREHCSEVNDDSGSDDSSEPCSSRLNSMRKPGSVSLNNIAQMGQQKKIEYISLISDDEDDDDCSQSGNLVTTFSHTSINRTTSEVTNIAALYGDSSLSSGRSRRSEATRKKNDANCLDVLNNKRFFKNKRSSFYFKNFIRNQRVYIMDAKLCGNIGRYFNHSCSPNLFVQNVFVDTYDFSFPWIAFFALQHIKAGNELCWDYNYTIDSVKGRKLYCYCKTANCRGRLL